MKKLIALTLSLSLALGLAACSAPAANSPAPSATPAVSQAPEQTPEVPKNEQYDRVVVGAGGAGLAAAVEAGELGMKNVLILEKTAVTGGATVAAFGGFNCTNSRFMTAQGKEETPVMLVDKIIKNGKGAADEHLAGVIAMETPKVIEWLDGFGSQWGKIRYANLHCPTDGTVPGVELAQVLRRQADKLGMEIRFNTAATELLTDGEGRVSGVKVKGPGGEYAIDATAVILATGGYPNNKEILAKYQPSLVNIHLAPVTGTTGDGLLMAEKLGAKLRNMDLIQLSCAVVPSNIQLQLPHKNHGVVFVNKEGKRFTNEFSEASSDHRITDDILAQTDAECWAVYSDAIYQEFMAQGDAMDFFDAYRIENINKSGLVIQADTLEALCDKMGDVDKETFLATMSALKTDGIGNENVVKAADTYRKGPFYAVIVTPGVMDSLGGVEIDPTTRVLDNGNEPIKGLYAAGEVIGNCQGAYYSVGLAEAVVFGRLAVRNALWYIEDRGGQTEHVPFARESAGAEGPAVKGSFKDGTYTGEGQGNNGPIKVEVTVTGNSITEIKVTAHDETPTIYPAVEESFIPALIRTQDLNVDAVSGATNSSEGIRQAVKAALGE